MHKVVSELREREKELNCLYQVNEVLSDESQEIDDIFRQIVNIIPEGWQYPGICHVRIDFEDRCYSSPRFVSSKWEQSAHLVVDSNNVGVIRVFYSENPGTGFPFLPEEQQLLNTIAAHISHFIFRRRLKNTIYYLRENPDTPARIFKPGEDEHWKWREEMAHQIAAFTDYSQYGIRELYVIGSTKEATAGPSSDLDILCLFEGNPGQRENLKEYIQGWSKSLAVINYRKTGYDLRKDGLIDFHIITDEDINNKNSFASMIDKPGSSNSARKLNKSSKS